MVVNRKRKGWIKILIINAPQFENSDIELINNLNFCKVFTQTRLTDFFYHLLLYFLNFQENILWNKKVISHKLLEEFSQVVRFIDGLKGMRYFGN